VFKLVTMFGCVHGQTHRTLSAGL